MKKLNDFWPVCALLIALIGMSFGARGQYVLMPTTGHKDTTCSELTIYDDGGPNGHWSGHANASWTFHTTDTNNVFMVTYYISGYYDRGRIECGFYDSDSMDDNRCLHHSWMWWDYQRIIYTSGNVFTIGFASDDSNPDGDFMVHICEVSNVHAENVQTLNLGGDSAMVTWEQPAGTNYRWVVAYIEGRNNGPCDFADTNAVVHTQYSDTNFIILTGITNQISIQVYPETNAPCSYGYFGHYCPCVSVENLQVSYDPDSIRITWNNNASFWEAWCNLRPDGTWCDTVFYTPYISLPYGCANGNYNLHAMVGDCHRSQMSCNEGWWDFRRSPCSTLNELSARSISDSSLLIRWRDYDQWSYDSCLSYSVYYRDARYPADSNILWDVRTPEDGNSDYLDTITGLQPHTKYTISIIHNCKEGTHSCPAECDGVTTLGGCLDYINLWDLEQTHLTWGNYDDPYISATVDRDHSLSEARWSYNDPWVGNLWFWGSDRHQPFTDTTEYDWRTNWQLRKIPAGKLASLRLGNDGGVNAEAESITYDYTVDTLVHDLLVLQYALVMQNPDHTPQNQPHFTLELLDDQGQLMDSVCCHADFVSGSNTTGQGWHTESDGITMWKDWTTIGIDIAPYQGRNIKVRLTNKDCAEGGHFSYAYFAMHCDNKRIVLVNKCDSANFIHMQAPIGFEYRWWAKNNPSVILGTGNDQMVPIDSNVYVCRCSFVGKPQCYFELECRSIDVLPRPRLTYWVDTCAERATLISQSYLEMDSTYSAYTPQLVDSIYWHINGETRWGDTLRLSLTENRTYRPTLVARLTDSYCVDSLVQPIEVNFIYQKQIAGPDQICHGDTLRLTAQVRPVNAPTFLWHNGSRDSVFTMVPDFHHTDYSVVMENNGCLDTLFHHLTVYPSYDYLLEETICQGESFGQGFNQSTSGTYVRRLRTAHQCDSIVTLHLQVQPWRDTVINDELCHGYYYSYGGYRYSESGTFYDTVLTSIGCDSIRFRLNLQVPASVVHLDTAICAGQQYFFGDTWLAHPGEYTYVDTNVLGCDSTVLLQLRMRHTFHGIIYDTLCEGDQTWFEGLWIDSAGSYTVHLTTPEGCDSIRTLELELKSTSATWLEETLCHGQRYSVAWHSYGETGLYHDTLCNALECDSVITLQLTVTPPRVDSLYVDICPGEEYPFAGTTYWDSGVYMALGRDSLGCDTLTALVLTVRPAYRDTLIIQLMPDDTVAPGTYEEHFYSLYGCDSAVVFVLLESDPQGMGEEPTLSLKVYPNPTSGELRIENGESRIENIEVYDLQGRLIERPLNSQFSILNYPAGVYLVRVVTAEGSSMFRIIKQ